MKAIRIVSNKIVFDNGMTISDHHDQDCCEEVYADFEQLEDTNFMNEDFETLHIEGVEDAGIRINNYFVPCYNIQNGYYSGNLTILVRDKNGKVVEEFDAYECTKYEDV